jgi:hypothetical protein
VVTIAAVDDALLNGTTSFNLSHTSSGGGYSSSANAAITVHDNDSVPAGSLVITESSNATMVTEGAFSAVNRDSYTIALSSAPTANVTVAVVPQVHPRPISDHAKLVGYFANDAPASNDQKDRILFDYGDIITLYNTVYAASPGISAGTGATTEQRQAAHFAASTAVVDKFDLMWCGGQLKSQLPNFDMADINNPAVIHPRKSIIAATYNCYSTTRVNAGSDLASFNNEVRRRVQIAAYLSCLSPQSFVSK